MPHPDAQLLTIVAVLGLAWAAISLVVLAACRSAAIADAEAADCAGAGGTHLRLISDTSPREHVADGAQEDLHVAPERPVGRIQVVDRSHLA